MPEPEQVVVGERGRYELLNRLATGGMAEIWLARAQAGSGAGPFVVVKRLHAHLAQEARFNEMFMDEARMSARLAHPNIVRIHEVAESEAVPCIIMEYLEGESLGYISDSAIRKEVRLPPELITGIMAQVCDGLDYAHRLENEDGRPLNIIHRDISPENIIILFSGRVKLVDFGIAKALTRTALTTHETRTGVMKGKVAYMSPEQCLLEKLDVRTDIFSMGTVLWEVLAGRRLFKREVDLQTLRSIAFEEVSPVHEVRPGLSPELDGIVMRALKKEREERFSTARQVGAALRKYLASVGTEVGEAEIAGFLESVLSERIENKRRLLRDIESMLDRPGSLSLLKAETDFSLPSPPDGISAPPAGGDAPDPPWVGEDLFTGEEDEYAVLDRTEEIGEDSLPVGVTSTGTVEIAEELLPDETEESTQEVIIPEQTEERTGEDPEPTHEITSLPPMTEDSGDGDTVDVPFDMMKITEITEEQFALATPEARKPRRGWRMTILVLLAFLVGIAIAAVAVDRFTAWSEERPGPAVASAPAADRVPPADALIEVRSKPAGCRVWLNGDALPGLTPIEAVSVHAGREHVVTVRCRKHKKETRRVTPRPGQNVVVEVQPARARVASARPGFLRINSHPWSEVHVGGRKIGITPIARHKLPAGEHTVRLVNHKHDIDKTFEVTIRSGKTTSRVEEFRAP